MSYSKFHAVRTENFDGSMSDSKREAKWDAQLHMIAKNAGLMIVRKKRFPLIANNIKICDYESDWILFRGGDPFKTGKPSELVAVIDCKGFKTPLYKIKKKMMKAIYGIDIIEDLNEVVSLLSADLAGRNF